MANNTEHELKGGQREKERGRNLWQRMAFWKHELELAQGTIDEGARKAEMGDGTAAANCRAQGMRQQDKAHREMHEWPSR